MQAGVSPPPVSASFRHFPSVPPDFPPTSPAPPRILVIEDEPAIADTLAYALRTEGFAPVWRATGGEGLAELAAADGGAATAFALVILDVGLPDANGFDVCRKIRARSAVPVLFLTARGGETDRVVGLELGGDDYVTKPFSPREVTARVRAILRRGDAGGRGANIQPSTSNAQRSGAEARKQGAPSPTNSVADVAGEFSVDAERHEARYRGARLELTRYELRLLRALLARPGRVFSRDELMTAAWEDPGASLDRTVDAHIKTLRAKLRAVAPDTDPILTHRGLGYSLRDAAPKVERDVPGALRNPPGGRVPPPIPKASRPAR
jgi:two-component system catabolic regulation response regulator CreB